MAEKKCLIVDDDEMTLKLLSHYLKKVGYDVLCCTDGIQALDLCQKHNFECIFLDCEMPLMGGIAFLQNLGQTRNPKDMKIIMVTSHDVPSIMKDAANHGASGVILKPLLPANIEKKLQELHII